MFVRNQDIVLRKVGSFYFLVDPKKSYNSEHENIFQTNEIGAAIWDLLKDHNDLTAMHKSLISMLADDVDAQMSEQIKEDILSFVLQLEQNGFVTEV